MWRKLSRDDLFGSNPLLADGHDRHRFVWFVYETYNLMDREEKPSYIEAYTLEDSQYLHEFTLSLSGLEAKYFNEPFKGISHWYEPLVETPHLFLEFARLHKHTNRREAAWNWINKFGLLGLHKNSQKATSVRLGKNYMGIDPSQRVPMRLPEYGYRGGAEETFSRTMHEMQKASRTLDLYEASLAKDEGRLEELLDMESESLSTVFRRHVIHNTQERFDLSYKDALASVATHSAASAVEQILRQFTYPAIAPGRLPSPTGRPTEDWTPNSLESTVWPRNLLGAMYIQFYWLITSAGELSRCKYCNALMPSASSGFGDKNRKPRRDKKFCSSQCRQNYHYHHSTKPRRKENGA